MQSPNIFLSHYEHLNYDSTLVHESHRRLKRSLDSENSWLNIRFKSHGKNFHLRLKRDTSVFATDHSLDINGEKQGTSDLGFLFHGNLKGMFDAPILIFLVIQFIKD